MADVDERVKKIIVDRLLVDAGKVTKEAKFIDDLGADSLGTVEIVLAIEEEFNIVIHDDAAAKIRTVADAMNLINEMTGKSS